MSEFSREAKTGFSRPDLWNIEIPTENAATQHATVMQNFVDAIVENKPLIAPGEEGLYSVEVANAALYSSWTGQVVELPLDSAAYEQKLNEKIAGSQFEKKVVPVSAEDFTKSFTR